MTTETPKTQTPKTFEEVTDLLPQILERIVDLREAGADQSLIEAEEAKIRALSHWYDIPSETAHSECAYCNREVPDLSGSEAREVGWEVVAQDHAPWCEWVLTKAHSEGV